MWPFKRRAPEPKAKPRVRTYAAGEISRLTASMATNSMSADWDLRKSLPIIRARSRDLCQNNDYAKKFLQLCDTHVVGPAGFKLNVRAMDTDAKGKPVLDVEDSKAIRKAFKDWSKKENCDVTGKNSFRDLCSLFIKAVSRDGEVIIRKVYGRKAGKYGFQLQVLDIDRLDTNLNRVARGGENMIKMGVELTDYGKPVAYWLRIAHPGDSPYYTLQGKMYDRVPAEDIYHCFMPERPEQTRGVPWLHSAITRLNNLGAYEEAAVIAARVGAAKMGFFTTPEGDGAALADGTEANGTLVTEAEPGTFSVLPEGYSFESFDPDYPHALFPEFVKANLRGVSSGVGVSYNTLANDLEGVNFSSIRSGVMEERDNWKSIQNWMIENFLNDVFSSWLRLALLSAQIKLPGGSPLPAAKFVKFNAGEWQGRRWDWVDPLKDAQASKLEIDERLTSRRRIMAEQGLDMDDVFAEIAEEKQMMQELDIEPVIVQGGSGTAGDNASAKEDSAAE